jgi:diguanylate cyclase (GGDEF)-like protein
MIDVESTMAGRGALPHSGDASAFPPSTIARGWETVPDTLPIQVAESAGRPVRAEAPPSLRQPRRLRQPPALGNKVRIVVAALVVALALPAVATWAFGRVYRASETDRVDARLSASLRDAADRVSAIDGAAASSARALAESPAVQRALARHDSIALAGFASRQDFVSLSVRAAGQAPPPTGPEAVLRSVAVNGPAGALGSVDAVEHLSVLLRGLSVRTGTTLRVSSVGGPVGRPYYLTAGGRTYRAVRVPLGTGVDLLAVVPRREIDAVVHHRQLLAFGAAALTMVALALVILLLLPGGRSALRGFAGRRGQRSSLALFGEVIAAAHDPRALLPVILETTVSATGAMGGLLIWDGETVAEIGSDSRPAERLVLSLDDEVGDRLLVLHAPRLGFTAADRELAGSLAGHGRIALDNARLHGVVRRQAVTDDLTDLANRRKFMDALRQEVARSGRLETPLALVLFDLDHFKLINDRCGHQAGDDVLRSAADIIRARVRETDLAARIGGEEFAVILPGTGIVGAVSLAENLRADISEGVELPDEDLTLTASFGVAEHRRGEPAETLIGVADRAMYQAKAEGRDRVRSADVEPAE